MAQLAGLQTSTLRSYERIGLLQPPFRANCLNWVLGHIVNGRNRMLTLAVEEATWTEDESVRYRTDSDPITQSGHELHLDRLLADLKTSHERLQQTFHSLTPADLAQQIDDQFTLGRRLHGLLWHETCHVGQTELLRQLAGPSDKVI